MTKMTPFWPFYWFWIFWLRFQLFLHCKRDQNFKWPYLDHLWVYNAEIFFVCSNHPTAPYIQKAGRNSKKVVLRNTLVDKVKRLVSLCCGGLERVSLSPSDESGDSSPFSPLFRLAAACLCESSITFSSPSAPRPFPLMGTSLNQWSCQHFQ